MGWLRQSWQRAGCGSANELAELLLAHEDVPSSMSIKASSLANNLRSLDGGKRLGWWRRHHQLIEPLASVLERSPEELDQLLVEPPKSEGPGGEESTRIPLAANGRLRSLEPSEPLPPGFPDLLQRAGRWRRTWWTTLDRRARRIAGRWLEERGLARHVIATSLADALAKMPVEGRVFLELTTRVEADDYSAFADAAELDCIRLCVAAPFHWRSTWAPAPGGPFLFSASMDSGPWSDVDSAPLAESIEPLLSWAVDRVPRARRPKGDALVVHVRALEPMYTFTGPGDVLDFVGLWTTTSERDRPTVGDRGAWARRRLGAFSSQESPQPRIELDEVVGAMLRGALSDDPETWLYGQERMKWRDYLKKVASPDAPTLRELLESADAEIDADKIELLREALAPSPDAALDQLRRAGLLVLVGEGCESLDPLWAVNLRYLEALEQKLDGEARELGSLALHESLVDPIVERLLAGFANGDFRRARRVLGDAKRMTTDGRVLAAYEVCTCALGLAGLVLPELPPDLIELGLAALRQALISIDGEPAGLVVPLADDSLCSLPVFVLVTLSMEIALGPEAEREQSDELARLCTRASGAISRLMRVPGRGPQLVQGAFRLGAKLSPPLGEKALVQASDELRLPMRLYNTAPAWRDAGKISRLCIGIEQQARCSTLSLSPSALLLGIEAVSAHAVGTPGSLFEILWELWEFTGDLDETPPLRWIEESPGAAERVWRYGSTDRHKPFLLALLGRHEFPLSVARAFSADDWRMWLTLILDEASPRLSPQAPSSWDLLPKSVASDFVANAQIDDFSRAEIADAMWKIIPDLVVAQIQSGSTTLATAYARRAPDAALKSVLPAIAARLNETAVDAKERKRIAFWLENVVKARRPGWRSAVKLLRQRLTGLRSPLV
ncbi:MAG: hypothetical protein KC468_24450 [Myxococcales bacterium]|nr:hypothetical protein [Myxococcales bacterium]